MTSPPKVYFMTQTILWMWLCERSLETVAFDYRVLSMLIDPTGFMISKIEKIRQTLTQDRERESLLNKRISEIAKIDRNTKKRTLILKGLYRNVYIKKFIKKFLKIY